MQRRVSVGVLGLGIVMLMLSVPVVGQDIPISVGETRIVVDYPESITFELEAASTAADIVSAALNLEIRGAGRTDVQPAAFVPGRRVLASYEWRTLLQAVPPGAPVRYWWTIRDGAGNQSVTDAELLIVSDTRFTWRTLENDDVALWWYEGDAAFGERIFESAATALESMQTYTRLSLPFRIHVVLYPTGDDFGAWHTYRRDWVGGEAYPEMGLTVQIVPPDDSSTVQEWVQRVIPHEIAHLFFYQVTTTPFSGEPPTWLSEGFAQFQELVSNDAKLAWVEWVAQRGELIPLRLLSGSFTGDDERIALMYAESLSAVTFLFESWGEEGMRHLLSAYQAGESTDGALLEATGLDFEGFQQAWWEWLGGNPGAYPTLPPRLGIPTMPPMITRPPVPTPVPTGAPGATAMPRESPTPLAVEVASTTASLARITASPPADATPSPMGEGPGASKRKAPCLGALGLAAAILVAGIGRWVLQAG